MRHLRLAVGLSFLSLAACNTPSSAPSKAPQDGGENAASSDPAPAEPSTPGDAGSAEPGVPGGYKEQPVDGADIRATADKAVVLLRSRTGDDSLALVRIESAATQVVAGKNTRLTLVLKGAGGEKTAAVVVYRDLKGNESLSDVSGL